MSTPEAFDGFAYQRVNVGEVDLQVALAGQGSPVLLLHGFPESHLAWRHVAPLLAADHAVVCPDLRGYGASDKPRDRGDHTTYSKRTMALDAVRLMAALGHRRFSVVGHDRGALAAFRLGLDHPSVVETLAVLGVIPGLDMWESLRGTGAVFAWHLVFLAQPADLPERLIAAQPRRFYEHFLDGWTARPGAIPAGIRARYLAPLGEPDGVHAVCEDYRAGAFVDPLHDAEDPAQVAGAVTEQIALRTS